jgi:glycogenin glucosyltransferase
LNDYYSTWATQDIHKHLPFIYNMVASATYSYLPAFKRYKGIGVAFLYFSTNIAKFNDFVLKIDR